MPNQLDNLYGLKSVASTSLENSHILITPTSAGFGGPFVMPFFTVFNFDTGGGYMILIFDSTTLPANGTVTPIYWTFVGIATASIPAFLAIEFQYPLKAFNGLVIAGSTTLTTPFTLATATASKLAFQAQVGA